MLRPRAGEEFAQGRTAVPPALGLAPLSLAAVPLFPRVDTRQCASCGTQQELGQRPWTD